MMWKVPATLAQLQDYRSEHKSSYKQPRDPQKELQDDKLIITWLFTSNSSLSQ